MAIQDLEASGWQPEGGPYQAIVCSHVLEHLREPVALLGRLLLAANDHTRLIVALPNVLQWRQRASFLGGRFAYTDGGIMDRTHLRFFDWRSATRLVEDAGWEVERAFSGGPRPARGMETPRGG